VSGHGHVTPNPDGSKARCGGPALCRECARELASTGQPVRTGLSLAQNCEDWDVLPDLKYDEATDGFVYARTAMSRHGAKVPVARLRRIGWLDQQGRVWLRVFGLDAGRRAGRDGNAPAGRPRRARWDLTARLVANRPYRALP